jgi:type I restriction enzyme R subunit
MNADTSDYELQREVIELFGDRYTDMTLNDWRHIIEAYTPMVRDASRPKAKVVLMQPEQMPMAADDMSLDE